jgi:hypothetical protein
MKFDIGYLISIARELSPIVGFIAYFLVVENVPLQNHLIFAYLVICFFADILCDFKFTQSAVVFNIHDICQFIIIVAIYVNLFKKRGAFYLTTTILLYLIAITATITRIGIGIYHHHMWAFSGFLISILCMVYINASIIWPKDLSCHKDLYNTLMMNTSFLFYFTSTFILFSLSDLLFRELEPKTVQVAWSFHNLAGLIKNLGLAAAIFLTGRAPTIAASSPKSVNVDSN